MSCVYNNQLKLYCIIYTLWMSPMDELLNLLPTSRMLWTNPSDPSDPIAK